MGAGHSVTGKWENAPSPRGAESTGVDGNRQESCGGKQIVAAVPGQHRGTDERQSLSATFRTKGSGRANRQVSAAKFWISSATLITSTTYSRFGISAILTSA